MNVVFIIHRREDVTKLVFEAIRRNKPARLFVIADGPRSEDERKACLGTRAVTEEVDWPCKVLRDYSDENLGCRDRIISGLNWVFSEAEDAIILEDDCLPSDSFFRYSSELLERYREDERIGYVTGSNFIGIPRGYKDDYWLSRYLAISGWATWKRAWKMFDGEMHAWPSIGASWARSYFDRRWVASFWIKIFDAAWRKNGNAWGYNWLYTIQSNNMHAIVPRENLVLHMGYGDNATHTGDMPGYYKGISKNELHFPLRHPAVLERSKAFDRSFENVFAGGAVREQMFRNIRNKHFYGAWLRKVPILGDAWRRWRDRGKVQS